MTNPPPAAPAVSDKLSAVQALLAERSKRVSSVGAAVEVKALLERGKRYETRIMSLERELEASRGELSDLKTVLSVGALLASLAVFTLFGDTKVAIKVALPFALPS